MKITDNIMKWLIPISAFLLIFLIACSEDFPSNVESKEFVELKSIKITNAGPLGNEVLVGRVDENTKSIWFPRVEPDTDFSKLKFEVELSDGAMLDKDFYEVVIEEGQAEKDLIIKVLNGTRFREYRAMLRLNVPVWGADFKKGTYYDYTGNEIGNPVYPDFTSSVTRGSGFDGEHVLIVTRAAGGSHLLKASDLRKYEIKPLKLNMENVGGGTFPVNVGDIAFGHTYIANLSGGKVSPFKIYHWTDPSAPAEVIGNFNIANIPGAGDRHGDNMSMSIDKNGNGYMFFGDNAQKFILRIKVSNFTTLSEPTVLPSLAGLTFVMSYNRVGTSDDYIMTGYESAIHLVNEGGSISYSLDKSAIPLRSSDARIFEFNKERYLMATTAARSGSDPTVFNVYDITKGKTTAESLKVFNDESDKKPLLDYSLMGPINTAPATRTAYHITKGADGSDEMLTLFTATNDAGFVLIDFPIKSLEGE